jgi:hypothetical protein
MKQIFKTKFGQSLEKLEEASFKAEESFRSNNVSSSDFYPIIHFFTEVLSNTILFDTSLNPNSEFELRIYLNSVITCVVEGKSLYLKSNDFEIINGILKSSFYDGKIERINVKQDNNMSSLFMQSKGLNSFKTFNN